MTTSRTFWSIVCSTRALLALVVAGALYAQFDEAQFQGAYASWPPGGRSNLSSRFAAWDVAHYLRLSEDGYKAGSTSCAFYLLWPMVIRMGSVLTGGRPLLAAMLLANAFSILGLWMLFRLLQRCCGPETSRDALMLMLAFPGALFFSFPYSESLYFVVVMLFFWGLELERWAWVAVAGLLLPLTRPTGILMLLPLAWYCYQRQSRESSQPILAKQNMIWCLVLCPLLGYAAYFGLMYLWTGNPFEGFVAQRAYPNSPSIKNMFNVSGFWHAFTNVNSLDGMMDGVLDRAFFVLVVALLPLVYRLDKTWFWYTLPAGVVPALTSWFMSYRRYIIVLFPIFVVLARLLAKTKSRWLFWYYVVLLGALQAWAVARFVSFKWAG